MKKNPLADLPGRKIRRQYFNMPAYYTLYILATVLLTAHILRGGAELAGADEARELLTALSCLILPFLLILGVLSVFNRTRFGRVVAVLDNQGIHTTEGFFPWKTIVAVRYTLAFPSKYGANTPNTAVLSVYAPADRMPTTRRHPSKHPRKQTRKVRRGYTQAELREVEIPMAPLHLLFLARRHDPRIKLGLTREGKIVACLYVLLPVICAVFSIIFA